MTIGPLRELAAGHHLEVASRAGKALMRKPLLEVQNLLASFPGIEPGAPGCLHRLQHLEEQHRLAEDLLDLSPGCLHPGPQLWLREGMDGEAVRTEGLAREQDVQRP